MIFLLHLYKGEASVANILADHFINFGEKITVERGDMIYNALCSKKEKSAYLLTSGIVAMTRNTKDGEERIYLYLSGRRLIGFAPFLIQQLGTGVFENRDRRIGRPDISLAAKTRCELYRIREEVCRELLATDLKFNRLMIQALTVNYLELLEHFQQALEESAGTRFCRMLLEAYIEETDGKLVIPRNITFAEMSKYLGTHPVTVSRIFASLKKMGCIDKEHGVVVIKDKQKLIKLIENGEEIR